MISKKRSRCDSNSPTTDLTDSDESVSKKLISVIPRSISPDVRYTYTPLLAHVYNSCDYDLMYQFLYTYYRKDFVLHQEFRVDNNHPLATSSNFSGLVEVQGRSLAGQYWYERMHDSPDVVFKIEHVDITINDESLDGVIRCTFNLEGSQVVDASDPMYNPTMSTIDKENNVIYIKDDTDKNISLPNNMVGEDFDAIFRGESEVDFGIKEDSSLATDSDILYSEESSETFAIHPVNHFFQNTSDILKTRDEFAGLKVPLEEIKPVLLRPQVNHPHIHTVRYSHKGLVEMHFDADSQIYYSKFVLFIE